MYGGKAKQFPAHVAKTGWQDIWCSNCFHEAGVEGHPLFIMCSTQYHWPGESVSTYFKGGVVK
jgi:hypothetical protein